MILTSTGNYIYVLDQLIVHLFDTFCTNVISKCRLSNGRNAVRLTCISKVSGFFTHPEVFLNVMQSCVTCKCVGSHAIGYCMLFVKWLLNFPRNNIKMLKSLIVGITNFSIAQ